MVGRLLGVGEDPEPQRVGAAEQVGPVAARQEDLLTVGMSLAAALGRGFEVVTEYNGRMNLAASSPVPGTENRGVARAGLRVTRGALRLDAAGLFGATSTDLDLGATAGLTWTFRAFSMP